MRAHIVFTIFAKELRETLRDRRTLIVMIVLPVVLYPVLMLGTFSLIGLRKDKLDAQRSRILVTQESARIGAAFQDAKKLQLARASDLPAHDTEDGRKALLRERKVDAIVEVPPGADALFARGEIAQVRIYVDETRDDSRRAATRAESALTKLKKRIVEETLAARQLPPGVAEPMKVERRNVASPNRMGGFIVGQILPALLVSLLVVGAFYPAIDVTAGEKERATLETLLTAPVRPLEVVSGKFLAVLTVALLSGAAHLVSMGATFAQGLSMMPAGMGAAFDIPVARLLLIFVVLVPLGVLASAVCMAVAVLAQSFKEAQNFLTPTILVLVVPATLASSPGMELDAYLSMVPGLNTALLTRDLLVGDASLQSIFAVFASNLVLAALALSFAARFFSSEAVLFGSPRGVLRELRARAGRIPTPAGAFGFFVALFVLLWYGGQSLQAWSPLPGFFLSQWALILLPAVAFAVWRRYDLRATFSLRAPSTRGLLACLLVAAGLPAVVAALSALQSHLMPPPEQLQHAMRSFMEQTRAAGGDLLLFAAVAVTPAICEETAFRGVLLAGFGSRLRTGATVVLVSLLFGAFHLSIYRFVPTALAGAALTYLVLRTGSIWTSVLAHGLYNGLLVAAALYLDETAVSGQGMPPWWLVLVSAALLALGLWLARGATRPDDAPSQSTASGAARAS